MFLVFLLVYPFQIPPAKARGDLNFLQCIMRSVELRRSDIQIETKFHNYPELRRSGPLLALKGRNIFE